MIPIIIGALAVIAFLIWLFGVIVMRNPFMPASGMGTFGANAGLGFIFVLIFIALIIVGGIIVLGFALRFLGKNKKFEKMTGSPMAKIFNGRKSIYKK